MFVENLWNESKSLEIMLFYFGEVTSFCLAKDLFNVYNELHVAL